MFPRQLGPVTLTSRRSVCGWTRRHWLMTLWSAMSLLTFVWSFNVDTSKPIIYRGPKGSFFGFSVAMLENRKGGW